MWVLLLLCPLALGFSLEGGAQTPSIYDEGGSTGSGDGSRQRPLAHLNHAASLAGTAPTTATLWSSGTTLGHCCWAGCPQGWCPHSMGWSWSSGCPPTAWHCGSWPRGCLGCRLQCCS
ncbi:F2R like thrombin or trypsin receptor 3 [Rhinolophus ferrumequinum]|uniref:F2R like thrombin or trypsin receptor 3 n=1 Tax=Rhinolophus ferrumequinum TaxID=59479 RepID=A0A7J7TZU2_RHIFE|nr:F2R like thrombin or trypsin receptor 3 [Rhinolophus ferrumequinum]